ncbi:sulfatase [Pelagicoccus enzymogenes]|uniref:sulfatase family protein n=1 Tax=Pelagicoccus enzymogenes TaxID=2773457 RepID=UPI00280C40AA|nr:sulfatase [Pelagicoccus enzymogenes]MDQ8199442.1 sulfatase [Pelagicoccus enzymogenes]
MQKSPNILWIYAEDTSPWMTCYGDNTVQTTNIDKLAAEGVLFENCFAPSPVCSASRSGIILGTDPVKAGVHRHRSSRTQFDQIKLPNGLKALPQILKNAGYRTYNFGKDDFNFMYQWEDLYDNDHVEHFHWKESNGVGWKSIKPGDKPFFAQIQLEGGKSFRHKDLTSLKPELDKIGLPPYYPNHRVFREQYANHYACIRYVDQQVGEILNHLERLGISEETAVFFLSDHGMEGLRHKQFCYDGGLHIPMIAKIPWHPIQEPFQRRRPELTSALDIFATTLALAEHPIPDSCHSRDWFSPAYEPRKYVLSSRDRCDFTIDRICSVRTQRHRYILNQQPSKPWLQQSYRSNWIEEETWRKLAAEDRLTATEKVFISSQKPSEEFYDLDRDEHQVNNLIADPKYSNEIERCREVINQWSEATHEFASNPEGVERDVMGALARWREQCVDPEYNAPKLKHGKILEKLPELRPWFISEGVGPDDR